MPHQLSVGACKLLQSVTATDVDIFSSEYTVQLVNIKKVGNNLPASAPASSDRYRIIMSDGINYMQALLATHLNEMVQQDLIRKNTVVTLEKLMCNHIQGRRLVFILAFRVLGHPAEKIGDPQQMDSPSDHAVGNPAVNQNLAPPIPAVPAPVQTVQAASTSRPQAPIRDACFGNIYPIESLSPYLKNWPIKARVIQKSDIITWSNARGEGKFFSVTLLDDSGEIRATGFNLVCDELYHRLEEGKVYYISNPRVHLSRMKFSNNHWELAFQRNTEVEECHDVTNLPYIKYNFVSLDSLESLYKDPIWGEFPICDVIGVVKESSPMEENTSEVNHQASKRDLTLVDKMGFSVRVTLWGKQAEQYNDADAHPVIAFKGVKLGDFGGRSLSMFSSSSMQVNPEIEESFSLRAWYDANGAAQPFKAHSS